MKFKIIFLLFNILILLSFAIVVFMPFIMLGTEYSTTFWASSWYLPAVFLLIVLGIDAYFFMNWKLFVLLEEENWLAVVEYLEGTVLKKGRMRVLDVRTLIHSYYVTGNVSKVADVEKALREHKPSLLKRFILELGMPRVLKRDHAETVRFFEEFRGQRVPNELWVKFFHAFGMLMQREHLEGREELLKLSNKVKDPVLLLLVIYTLDPFRTLDDEALGRVERLKKELSTRHTREFMEKKIQKGKGNIAVVVMDPILSDALAWLYGEAAWTAGTAGAGPGSGDNAGTAGASTVDGEGQSNVTGS